MLKKINTDYRILDIISCLLGWAIACLIWLLISRPAVASNELEKVINAGQLAAFSPVLMVSAIIGAVGSYLAFGEDKKFPPSSASVGHVMLNFGAGLFLTRGSLELMGQTQSSDDVIVFTSFLWASVGYFLLRMLITVAQSEQIRHVLPCWVARVLGVDIHQQPQQQKPTIDIADVSNGDSDYDANHAPDDNDSHYQYKENDQ